MHAGQDVQTPIELLDRPLNQSYISCGRASVPPVLYIYGYGFYMAMAF
jgi:hypothetical protein